MSKRAILKNAKELSQNTKSEENEITLEDFFSTYKNKRGYDKPLENSAPSAENGTLSKHTDDKKCESFKSEINYTKSMKSSSLRNKKSRLHKIETDSEESGSLMLTRESDSEKDLREYSPIDKRKRRKNERSNLIAEKDPNLPLEGKSIVVTGLFEKKSRSEIEDLVKILGGKLTSAVSGRTSYLIAGYILEDGRGITEGLKYKSAISKNIQILSENEFINMFPIDSPKITREDIERLNMNQAIENSKDYKGEDKLWTDKYKPSNIDEVLGNSEVIRKLVTWLNDWRSVIIEGKKKNPSKATFSPGSRFPQIENINARAVLLSGPPGIGKTTTANLVAKECGYIAIEMNASDDRTKSVIEDLAENAIGGYTLTDFAHGNINKFNSKYSENLNSNIVLIMDEVDGLGGSDRGGAAALGKLILKTKWPIICLCNDRQNEKVRNLASKCYDLRFSRPSKPQIIKRIQEISSKEGLNIEANAVDLLCESVGNDLRQILNELQLMRLSKSTLRFVDMKNEISKPVKDSQVTLDIFSATKKLLTASDAHRLSINDRIEMFFIDFDLIPLLIQENYITAFSGQSSYRISAQSKGNISYGNIDIISQIANLFAEADIYNFKLRSNNDWSLLSEIAINCAVIPSGSQFQGSFLARPEFPKWLGKNSTRNKNRRLLSELLAYLTVGTKGTCPSSQGMKLNGYLDCLYHKAIIPLLNKNGDFKDNIEKSLDIMIKYGLNRDHFTEHITSLMLKQQDKLYDKVDSKTKSAMTRVINSTIHAVKVSLPKINKSELSDSENDKNLEDNTDELNGGEIGKQNQIGSLVKVRKATGNSIPKKSATRSHSKSKKK
ncbi:putative replication factor C subunit protein [Cryptosporidium serpentis]